MGKESKVIQPSMLRGGQAAGRSSYVRAEPCGSRPKKPPSEFAAVASPAVCRQGKSIATATAQPERSARCVCGRAESRTLYVLQAERPRNSPQSPSPSTEPPLSFLITKGKQSMAGLTYVSGGACPPAEFIVGPLLPALGSTNEPDLIHLKDTYFQNLLLNFPRCRSIP